MANMSKEQKNKFFVKMNAIGNDFIIFDNRLFIEEKKSFTSSEIAKLSNRKNIGCDQFIVIKNSNKADCLMEIYNSDGSTSGACGNATRCVASLIIEEKKTNKITIETASGILKCESVENEIAVEMGVPNFANNQHFYFDDLKFFSVDVGNPHAVSFVDEIPTDEVFFKISPQIQSHKFFPQKTNVEFAKIISDKLIEVRVFERGVGETLACGSGACAVAAIAIANKMITSDEVIIRFKGGDLLIKWQSKTSQIVMQGGYKKVFFGTVDENFI